MPPEPPPWHPIATAPCNDVWAYVRDSDGREYITDFDHDSDPAWWAERGYTHWRHATDAEMDTFWITCT